jgi:hypothetical protein
VGDEVRRPASRFTASIFDLLGALRAVGFDGVQEPKGIDERERERLTFFRGDVPIPPYAQWAQTDETLGSIAALLRRFHDAPMGFDGSKWAWSEELEDPAGGPVSVRTTCAWRTWSFETASRLP